METQIWVLGGLAAALWLISFTGAVTWAKNISTQLTSINEKLAAQGEVVAVAKSKAETHDEDIRTLRHELGTAHRRIDDLAKHKGLAS